MTRHMWGRLAAAALIALTTATALAPAGNASTYDAADAADRTAPDDRTVVTFAAPACNGCRLTLVQANEDELWSSKERTVRDGKVSFNVLTEHTRGMSVAIRTPWEGGTGYVTQVAFKYSGKEVGDHVSFSEARHARKASMCWAGTSADHATIRLATRRVTVSGYEGPRTPAALVYTSVTQEAMVPMLRTFHGITGTQDVPFCGPR